MNLPNYDEPRASGNDMEPGRHILEEHLHVVLHDQADTFATLPARAVRQVTGPAVEVGPLSLSPDDARLLAASLTILADVADGR